MTDFNKGDFTQQGVNGHVNAKLRLNAKRYLDIDLTSNEQASGCTISGHVYDSLNDITYPIGSAPSGNIEITENTAEGSPLNIAQYATATVNVPAPAPTGEPVLITSVNLGAVNTTNTAATTVTTSTLSLDYTPYTLLLLITKGAKDTAGYYHGTINIVVIEGKSDVTEPDGSGLSTRALMYYYDSEGVLVSKTATTSAGVYASSFSYSGTDTSITWSSKYDSAKGTIDDNFTAYIYGVKLSEMI